MLTAKLTKQLTPRRTSLLEKLMVTKLVKKFPMLYVTWRLITICHWTLSEPEKYVQKKTVPNSHWVDCIVNKSKKKQFTLRFHSASVQLPVRYDNVLRTTAGMPMNMRIWRLHGSDNNRQRQNAADDPLNHTCSNLS
jgi:hypothetical protein